MKRFIRTEEGQALVYVAIAMILILAVLALALDAGQLYAERRHLQNAADAGALAGANSLCKDNDATKAKIIAKDVAEGPNAAPLAEPDVKPDTVAGWGGVVSVRTSQQGTSYFAALKGIVDQPEVSAYAEATCGCAGDACSLWPIALNGSKYNSIAGRCDGTGPPPSYYIWEQCPTDVDVATDWDVCDPANPDYKDNQFQCWLCKSHLSIPPGCYPPNVIPGSQEAWVDFPGIEGDPYPDPCTKTPGGGAAELAYRLRGYKDANTYCRSCAQTSKCVPESEGAKVSGLKAAAERKGDVVTFPLTTSECDPIGGHRQFKIDAIGCAQVKNITRLNLNGAACKALKDQWDVDKTHTGPMKIRVIEMQTLCPGDPLAAKCYKPGGDLSGSCSSNITYGRGVSLTK